MSNVSDPVANRLKLKCKYKRELKCEWQIKILRQMFKDLDGKISKEFRNEAVTKTGLKWSKIYKWVFDQGDKLP